MKPPRLLQHIFDSDIKKQFVAAKSSLVGLIFLNLPAMTSCVLGHVRVSDSARAALSGVFSILRDAENNARKYPRRALFTADKASEYVCAAILAVRFSLETFLLGNKRRRKI
jgi:hypothetical protein